MTDYINNMNFDMDSKKLNIKIGNSSLKEIISQIPEQYIKKTKYNKQSLKWFEYHGIDVDQKEIKVKCRLRVKKYEKLIKLVKIYDNAWDIKAGLKLEVDTNRKLNARFVIRDTKSDLPSGLLGVFLAGVDLSVGTGQSILTGNFSTLSNEIGQYISKKINNSDQADISNLFKKISKMNQQGIIFLEKVKYVDEGIILQSNSIKF